MMVDCLNRSRQRTRNRPGLSDDRSTTQSEWPRFKVSSCVADVLRFNAHVSRRARNAAIALGAVLWGSASSLALNPSLDVSQYAHTAWTTRDGFFKGNIYAIAQTSDGYLWLGTEFGLFRFDGIHSIHWQPPAGQQLPDQNINSLLAARDGTLWIGTMGGLASWNGSKLIQYPEVGSRFVESLLEDRDGTVWAGALFSPNVGPTGLLCAVRSGRTQCYGKDGTFGIAVPGLYEDSSGTLWVLAQSGLWRWRPGPPVRYPTTPVEVTALTSSDDGRPLFSIRGGGLMHLLGDRSKSYPIREAGNANRILRDHDVDANKLLRDHNGGLWIGTVERGLIHVHNGRTDVFTGSNGLSGDVILSLFEDREGNIWVATTGGLDRFRELPVTTVSSQQGLSSDASQSILATTDGSIWIGSHDGLTRLQNGKISVFRKSSGLPDENVQSLYQDVRGRVWVATDHGLVVLEDGSFVAIKALTSSHAHLLHFITGDEAGNIWISEHENLLHLLNWRLIEKIPWPELGHRESAEVLLADEKQGGVWLGFWTGGGVEYFRDGKVRETYTVADGLGQGHVADLEFDRDGALWASTQDGGASRIKDGRITTLTTRNGLPCNTIHWTMEDDDRSLWLYTACGLVRIARSELEAWIGNPKRTIQTTVWDAADGVRLRSSAASTFGPRVAKSSDDKLWFLTGLGVQVVDPHHLAFNELPPPVHIEQIIADRNIYWQNAIGRSASEIRLPARTHDLTIHYTALSLVAPDKVHFKYTLEGQDRDWREVVNEHQVQYSNLPPRHYTFRVIACNNSGVWNGQGDTFEFSVAPAYYQTNWFLALCALAVLAFLWLAYRFRVRQVRQEITIGLEAKISERTRIARDLHDTLLQSFHGLLYRFHAVRNLLPGRPDEAIQALDSALVRAEQAMDEGRQSIQELRTGLFGENQLDQMLIAIGQEFASSQQDQDGTPSFKVIEEGERRGLSPIIREEIIRITRELLLNAFRHASAHAIEVEIRYGRELFSLIVRDDGKGIEPKVLKEGGRAGHWGIPGVHERARGIGAQLEFWSEAGAGTEVRLTIPGSVGYDRSQRQRRLGLFRPRRQS